MQLIDVMGRASVEAVLELSPRQVAGEPQQGKPRTGEIGWHGRQPGRVNLKERKLRVRRPRLRKKGRGAGREVPVPAYEAMRQDGATGQRMLEVLGQRLLFPAADPGRMDAEHLRDLRRRLVRLDGLDRHSGLQAGRVTLPATGH